MRNTDVVPWSKTPVYPVLHAIGLAMKGKRLNPRTLEDLPVGSGAIIPDHVADVIHVSGKQLNQRKGHYRITIDGPRLSGRWIFSSGDLEKAAQEALHYTDR